MSSSSEVIGFGGLSSEDTINPDTTEIYVQYHNHAPTVCRLPSSAYKGDAIILTLDKDYKCKASIKRPMVLVKDVGDVHSQGDHNLCNNAQSVDGAFCFVGGKAININSK